ncbi:molybdenum cofactor synthesis domain-containing protein [Trueperella bonasi]|uniref:Molybdenum cofactor synthesis domain-containing protein n=1 Tax=Trueperella bonasi TaxID=312286 RepID=A0ABT9NHI3_9ACTO|nr:MogA/MoaB family molybdenum cofactor biosynthesis protein [Trueperella bonasi]MDP9806253.1 molybdenum cofactor synthesis domain-containing protein [Trueperella bonasi]
MDIKAAVVTVSDRASAGKREDLSGPTAVRILEEAGIAVLETAVVPDDVRAIAEAVQTVAYEEIDLVITTGGTGITPQDYTARAMDPLLRFDIPGIAEAIRAKGVEKGVPGALLSRGRAGVMVGGRNRTLVINLAGSVGAVEDGMEVIIPVLEHAVEQMRGGDH